MESLQEELTERELDVINAIKTGAITDAEIANALKISVNTVVTHMQKLYQKLGIYGGQKRATLVYKILSATTAEIMKECLSMGIIL